MKRSYQAMLTLLYCLIAYCATGQSISGTTVFCAGSTTVLTGSPGGGTWSSATTGVASVGLSSGVVTGVAAGICVLSYTSSAGLATTVVTVNPLPAAITGAATVCTGATVTLADASSGGTWSSANISIGTVNAVTGAVNGVAAGTVTISYTLPTGCSASRLLTVNASPAPVSGPASLCAGSTATYSSSTGGGIWSSSNSGVGTVDAAGGSSTVLTGIAAGTTTIVYVLTSVGCVSFANVTVNATAAGPISGPGTVCTGGTITLTAAAPGGTWSAGNSNATITGAGIVTGVSAGTVTISYSATGACGPALATYVVTVTAAPAAITGASTICTGTETLYTHPVSGGTWSSSTPALGSINAATGMATGIAAGVMTISYAVSAGCVATKPVTVSVSPSAITGTPSACIGGTSALFSSPTGGMWISPTPAIATIDGASGLMTGVATGSTVIYYVLGGCISSLPVTIGATTGPITGPATVCMGTTAALSVVAAGGTWSADNSNVTVSGAGVVTGVSAGTVTITYSLTGTCGAATGVYIMTIDPAPAAITGTGTVCVGATTTLAHAIAGGTWSTGAAAVGTVDATGGTVTGIAAGTVNISYTLPSGCAVSRVVTVNPLPIVSGPGVVCTGGTITFSGTPAGGTWVSGTVAAGTISAGGTLSGIAAGSTIVYYILPTGCLANIPVTVSAGSGPAGPISGPAEVCVGSAVTLAGATGGGAWSAGNANATVSAGGVVTGVSAGTVIITYSVTGSCGTSAATITITVHAIPPAIGGPSVSCAGSSITLTNTATGGTWASGSPAIATIVPASGVTTGVSAGTAIITFSLATGCTATKTITINPLPAAITGPTAACIGAATTLSSTSTGGTWSSSNTAIGTIDAASGIFTGIAAGTSTISYTFSGSGCATTVTVTVGTLVAGSITGPGSVCEGSTITLADAAGGGTWGAGNANATVSAAGLVTGVIPGTVSIAYTVSGACGSAIAVTIVTVNANPAAVTGATTVCTGDMITLLCSTAGGTWTSSAPLAGAIDAGTGILSGLSAGTTTVSYTLATGCASAISVTVNSSPAAISGPTDVFAGSSITLVSATMGGVWTTAAGTIATVDAGTGVITGVAAGTATISYATGSCIATYVVTVNAVPSSVAGVNTTANTGCYPNPAKRGITTLKWNGQTPGTAMLQLTDVTGRQVYAYAINMSTANGAMQLALTGVKPGVYFISLSSATMHYVNKLVIQD